MSGAGVHGLTVYDLIARGAAVHGDAPAVIQDGREVSFRQFRRQVDRLAAGLDGLTLRPGERSCGIKSTLELATVCDLIQLTLCIGDFQLRGINL